MNSSIRTAQRFAFSSSAKFMPITMSPAIHTSSATKVKISSELSGRRRRTIQRPAHTTISDPIRPPHVWN